MGRRGMAILIVAVLVAAGGFYAWRSAKARNAKPRYRTEAVQRGDIKVQVTATGNLQAVTTVLVGSQVSGTISALFADFNDRVHNGQVLAQLDPTFLKAQVAQSRADLQRVDVQVRQAELDSARVFPLLSGGLVSVADIDASRTALDEARASRSSSAAALDRAETNLRYATIHSPIDGVVISRDVDVGQTVAASLSAPTLFTIANDLQKMQLEVAVDEADIGMVRGGQHATFSVDAYPTEQFRGVVHQIRLAPETVQNVVTYTVVILVENPEEKLLPGMTANVSILVDEAKDVLKVPALALRFRPAAGAAAGGAGGVGGVGGAAAGRGELRQAGGGGGAPEGGRRGGARPDSARPGGPSGAPAGGGPAGEAPGAGAWQPGTVYVLERGTELRPVDVMTGQTDGTFVAVRGEALHDGTPVVLGLEVAGQGGGNNNQGAVNPFTPRMPAGGRR
ncbi:MAG: efflux RND transporter periplasmic adaptor subunit [Candidatus Krumholzibacteriia bacterium]